MWITVDNFFRLWKRTFVCGQLDNIFENFWLFLLLFVKFLHLKKKLPTVIHKNIVDKCYQQSRMWTSYPQKNVVLHKIIVENAGFLNSNC